MNVEISAALTGMTAGFDMLRRAVSARDDAKLKAALADMAMKLHDACISALASAEAQHALALKVQSLQEELRELKLAAQQRESYAITEVRPGAYAYAAQPAEREDVRPPYLCQPCYDKGVKSVLQRSPNGLALECHLESRHRLSIADAPRLPIVNYGNPFN